MAELRVEDLTKIFPSGTRAVDEVSLTVDSGECLSLVGPSGCGKSTFLRLLGGLEAQTEGRILIDGIPVHTLPAHRRQVGLMLQRPAFLTNGTVAQNLALAWTFQEPMARWLGLGSSREGDLNRIAELLGLSKLLNRPLGQLSGGQQQRVALGRCLLRKSRVTLLDEPLGSLDAPLRTELRRQIRSLARAERLTVIHVTHDPAEALAVGDRVAVMREGRIVQIEAPAQLRRAPNHRFIAELIHHEDGGFNWLDGVIVKEEIESFFQNPLGRWPLSLQIVEHLRESLYRGITKPEGFTVESSNHGPLENLRRTQENFDANQEIVAMIVGIPAADVQCTTAVGGLGDLIGIPAKVQELEFTTTGNWVIGSHARGRWIGRADDSERLEIGQDVTMLFSVTRLHWFDTATGRSLALPSR